MPKVTTPARGMVERYVYEETLYATVVRILAGDQLRYLTQQHSQSRNPLVVHAPSCALCHSSYHPSSRAVAHSCGHSYHAQCVGNAVSCVLCTGGSQRDNSSQDTQQNDTSQQPMAGLDETQLEGIRRVKVQGSGGSRLQFLEDLSAPRTGDTTSPSTPGRTSGGSISSNQDIWLSQSFALKLAPPATDFDAGDDGLL